jgi:PAS domain S-box-containing protein
MKKKTKDKVPVADISLKQETGDIAASRWIEDALLKKKEQLRAAFENAPDGIYVNDLNGNFLYGNRKAEEILGYGREELVGKNFLEAGILPPDMVDAAAIILKNSMDRLPTGPDEIEMIRKDGRRIRVEITTSAVQLFGETTILGFVRDITERRRSEEALRESESRFRLLAGNSTDVIWTMSLDGRFTYVSPSVKTLSGYTPEETLEIPFDRYVVESYVEPVMSRIAAQLAKPPAERLQSLQMELQQYCKGGGVKDIEVAVGWLLDNSGNLVGIQGSTRDITDKKLAERALIRSEERFRKLIENSSDISIILDENGNETYVSDSVERITGFKPEECTGVQSFSFVHPDDLKAVAETFSRLLENPYEVLKDEYRHRTKDGGWVYLEAIGVNRLDDPVIRGIVLNVRDVTERRGAEALQSMQAEMLDAAPSSITVHGFDGRFLYANRRTFEIHGYEPGEFMRLNLRDIDVPESAALIGERMKQILEKGEASFEVGHFRKDGSTMPMQVYTRKVEWFGRPAMISMATDISERKRAEAALQKSEKRFREVLEGSQDILYRQRLTDGALEFMSPSALPVLGYTPEEMYAFTPGEENKLFHPDDLPALRSFLDDLIAADAGNKKFIEREFRMISKSGQVRWIHGSYQLARDTAGNPEYVVGTLKNITEQKRIDEEKTRLQAQLQQALKMEAVGRLAGGVAHDFNNLLTSITGNISLALMDLNPADPLHATLGEVGKAADSAASLTKQLLAFSRKQVVEPRVLNLGELAANLNRMLIRLIGEDIDLKIISSGGLGSVKVDPVQFEQVLINLAVNARDAMPEGGELTIETSNASLDDDYCRLHPHLKPGTFVMLSVKDTGHGMTAEVREHLFEPFFTTKPQGRGTGLGLAMIYGVVKQAGGLIEVDSEAGIGTTFRIYLPMVRERAEKLDRGSRAGDLKGGSETILLVEDDPMVMNMAVRILKQLGYSVLHAEDGARALLLAEGYKGRIDLLVTDVIMPGINGLDLADRLKSIHPETAMIFTSGYTDDVLTDHGVTGEHLHFIAKPYSPQSMAGKIREVLDK